MSIEHTRRTFPDTRLYYAVCAALALTGYVCGYCHGSASRRGKTATVREIQAQAVARGYAEYRRGPWWQGWPLEWTWKTEMYANSLDNADD